MRQFEKLKIPLLIALLAAVLAGGLALAERRSLPERPLEISPPEPLEVTVYITGEVRNPGLYSLPYGSRVKDAVEAAGGFTNEAYVEGLNLAARLRDGQHIPVYSRNEVPQKVNINTADKWLLEALPGIGPTTARRIVEYREEHGPFGQIEDIKKVRGIGEGTFEKIKDKITI